MRDGILGVDPDRRLEFLDRRVELPLASQGAAEVVVGGGLVGLELDRLAKCVFGLGKLRPGVQGVAKPVTRLGVLE